MAYIASKGYFKRYENEGNSEIYVFDNTINNIINDCSSKISNIRCKIH